MHSSQQYMNHKITMHRQRGAWLIGTLIAIVIILGGGLAISGLFSNLMSGSGQVKADNEALELAREQIEIVRSITVKNDYITTLAATDPEVNDGFVEYASKKNGVNAEFTLEWKIIDAINNLKEVIVRVSYVDSSAELQQVFLSSYIAFSDPVEAGALGTTPASDGALPGTARSAEEGPEEDSNITQTSGDTEPGVAGIIGDIGTGINSVGELTVYQGTLDGTDDDNDKIKLTVFGGIILKFQGTLYYEKGNYDSKDDRPTDDKPYIRATSPSFCKFYPFDPGYQDDLDLSDDEKDDLAADELWQECETYNNSNNPDNNLNPDNLSCGVYWCAASGDCSNETAGSINADNSPSTDCKKGISAGGSASDNLSGTDLTNHLNAIKALELNGGWYGKIGVLFPEIEAPGQIPRVCMGDWATYAVSETEPKPPARFFVSEREDAGDPVSVIGYEGINRSYNNCKYIAVDVNNDTCDETAYNNKLVIKDFSLRDIKRPLAPNIPNSVETPEECPTAPSCNCTFAGGAWGTPTSEEVDSTSEEYCNTCSTINCSSVVGNNPDEGTYNLSCPAPTP